MSGFEIVVIYRNPTDFPEKFVVRRQRVVGHDVVPDKAPVAVVDDLEAARAAVRSRYPGRFTYHLPRHQNDEATIVEAWL